MTVSERLRQWREASKPVVPEHLELAASTLSPALYALFESQHPRDIVHSAGTAEWLLRRGHDDPPLIQAALLHDIGKGDQRRIDRAVYVLASRAGLARAGASDDSRLRLRRAIARSLAHSRTGAGMIEAAGAHARAVELTRRHHAAAGDDAMLAMLQAADAAC